MDGLFGELYDEVLEGSDDPHAGLTDRDDLLLYCRVAGEGDADWAAMADRLSSVDGWAAWVDYAAERYAGEDGGAA